MILWPSCLTLLKGISSFLEKEQNLQNPSLLCHLDTAQLSSCIPNLLPSHSLSSSPKVSLSGPLIRYSSFLPSVLYTCSSFFLKSSLSPHPVFFYHPLDLKQLKLHVLQESLLRILPSLPHSRTAMTQKPKTQRCWKWESCSFTDQQVEAWKGISSRASPQLPPQMRCADCGILVPWPGIESGSSAVKAWSPNYWTTREFPGIFLLDDRTVVGEDVPSWNWRHCLMFLNDAIKAFVSILACCNKIPQAGWLWSLFLF